jgi:hypothetical protein
MKINDTLFKINQNSILFTSTQRNTIYYLKSYLCPFGALYCWAHKIGPPLYVLSWQAPSAPERKSGQKNNFSLYADKNHSSETVNSISFSLNLRCFLVLTFYENTHGTADIWSCVAAGINENKTGRKNYQDTTCVEAFRSVRLGGVSQRLWRWRPPVKGQRPSEAALNKVMGTKG